MPNSDGHSFVEEKTEVLYGPDEIVRKTVDTCYAIERTIDGCVDHYSPSIFVIPKSSRSHQNISKQLVTKVKCTRLCLL
jgi:hypothetical protein